MEEKLEKFLSDVRLIVQEDLEKGEAFASITLNPTLRWMKFILTDDQPNENKQRVPQKEFPNLIKTGVHMPIKMAEGEIAEGHEDSFPIGVITHLKQITNKIEGLAALWSRERPEDIEYIIEKFESGTTPQISYEIPYTDSETSEEGIEDLKGTCLGAATLVGMPAYAGRTPVLAVASKGDNNLEETMEELETLKQQLKEAQNEVKELKDELTAKNETEASLNEELTELKEFKTEIDKLADEAVKLDAIEEKFTEAGIERDEDYFTENKEMLLALDDAAIDFMVQEYVSFAEEQKGVEPKPKDDDIPPIKGDKNTVPSDIKEISEALKEFITTKK